MFLYERAAIDLFSASVWLYKRVRCNYVIRDNGITVNFWTDLKKYIDLALKTICFSNKPCFKMSKKAYY